MTIEKLVDNLVVALVKANRGPCPTELAREGGAGAIVVIRAGKVIVRAVPGALLPREYKTLCRELANGARHEIRSSTAPPWGELHAQLHPEAEAGLELAIEIGGE